MDIIKKPKESEDSSPFDCLPDDVLLQIVGKLLDLKTLCLSELISKRFYRTVLQVEVISFTSPIVVDPPDFRGVTTAPIAWLRSLRSAILSLKKFGKVKSLCIQLPSINTDNDLLFQWKIKFGKKCDLFICLSPNSIYHNKESYVNENDEEQQTMETHEKSYYIALLCMMYVWMSHWMVWSYIETIPLLEEVSIADSGKRGRLSVGAGKIAEMRNCPTPPFEKFEERFMFHISMYRKSRQLSNFPFLELPISGYVMKEVSLILLKLNDVPHDSDDDNYNTMYGDEDFFEDDVLSATFNDFEDVVYSEALNEFLKESRGGIKFMMSSGARRVGSTFHIGQGF